MHDRILSLEALAIVASAFPAQLAALPSLFARPTRSRQRPVMVPAVESWILPVATWSVVILAFVVSRSALRLVGSHDLVWIVIGLVAAPCTLGVELVVGAMMFWRVHGQLPRSVEMAERVEGAGGGLAVSTATTGLGEEVLYRGVWVQILFYHWLWPGWVGAVAITGAYALNHVYFGAAVVVQKSASGLVLLVLALSSGGILASIIAHVGENILIAYLPRTVVRSQR